MYIVSLFIEGDCYEQEKQINQKITALYCRISLDDGGDNESMSISNQKLMLKEFAEKTGCSSMSIMWTMVTQAEISIVRLFSG